MALKDSTKWVGRFDIKPTVSDKITLLENGNSTIFIFGSKVANSISFDNSDELVKILYIEDFPEFV